MAQDAIIDCFDLVYRRLGDWKTVQMAKCLPAETKRGHWDPRLLRRLASGQEPTPPTLKTWLEALAEVMATPQPGEEGAEPMRREELNEVREAMGGWQFWQLSLATGLPEARLRVALPSATSARLRSLRKLVELGPRVADMAWRQLVAFRHKDPEQREKLFARQDRRAMEKAVADWERAKVRTMDFEKVAASSPLDITAGRVVSKGESEKRTTPVGAVVR